MLYLQSGIEVWCNGSTTDFGSVCPGSNPGTSTFFTGHIPEPLRLRSKRIFLNPSHFVTAPFRGKPARQAFAGRLRCFDVCDISLTLRRAACAAPLGVAFRLCRSKVPRPHRSADADFLVKPFGGVLVRGVSPGPCGAQGPFQFCLGKIPAPGGSLMRTSRTAFLFCDTDGANFPAP